MMANGRKNWDVIDQGRISVCNRGIKTGECKACGDSFMAYPFYLNHVRILKRDAALTASPERN